jgi:DNA-binding IclR family transcriptional regulator
MARTAGKIAGKKNGSAGGSVQSAEVGIRVLIALGELGGEESLGNIAKHLGMPPAKAHRYLASLIKVGAVERSYNSNRYALGGAALRLGLVALSRVDVIEAAHSFLDELRDKLEASLMLAVWGTSGPTIVRWLESARPVTVNVKVGSSMPLLRSATGQVFAAILPSSMTSSLLKEELSDIRRLQGKAPSAEEIDAKFKKIRKAGLAHTAGGVIPGVLALAAPIYNSSNQLAAVMTALGTAGFFDDSMDGVTARTLLDSSQRLSMRLGSTLFTSRAQK